MIDKRYVYLTSLNLICDQPESYELWMNEVELFTLVLFIQYMIAMYIICVDTGILIMLHCTYIIRNYYTVEVQGQGSQ